MYIVFRSYSGQGATELFDLLEERKADVQEVISGVPGFVSYAAVRSEDGGTAVTICQDKDGVDESNRRAAQWVSDNLDTSISSPAITEGEAFIQF
ncbi:MAG: hypothetical protein WAK93_13455 [Solirubrobacteraceae bacterium]